MFDVNKQFDKFYGVKRVCTPNQDGDRLRCRDTRAVAEFSTGHPTHPQRTDAQPSRAVSPNPATFDPDPPDWDYFNQHSYAELTGGY